MSEAIQNAVNELKARVERLDAEALQIKRTVNLLCKQDGMEPVYVDTDSEASAIGNSLRIAPDRFHGSPLATAVRAYLTLRKKAGLDGPAGPEDIYKSLVTGGYVFETKNEATALNGLRISLAKSRALRRLPNGCFGLDEWYPALRKSRDKDESEVNDGDPAKVEMNPQ